jgi:hypothetical protein
MTEADFQALLARLVDMPHLTEAARDDIRAMVDHADALRTRVVRAMDENDDWDKNEPALGFVAYGENRREDIKMLGARLR